MARKSQKNSSDEHQFDLFTYLAQVERENDVEERIAHDQSSSSASHDVQALRPTAK